MPPRRAAWSVPTEQSLRDLASFDAADARVVSFYLDVDGRRHPRRQDYLKAASDLLRGIDAASLPRVARFSVEADIRRIGEFLAKEFERGPVRGLVVFACAGARLWEVFRLPVPVRSRIVVDRHPHVLRLEALTARAEHLATVIVGRDRARLFTTRLGETIEHNPVAGEVPGQHDQGGWSQANFQRHIDELAARHYRNVSDALFALSQRDPLDLIVLGGPDEVVAMFEKTLHPWLAERIAARVHLPPGATRERVRQATIEVWDQIESDRASDGVARILEEYAAGRGAVVGITKTLDALQQGRVDVLALSDGAGLLRRGMRCGGCGLLSLDAQKCPSCGGACEPVADLAEELVDEALRRRCRVVTAQTRPLPEGVGALLRY